ncbi:MAG: hypothetical protein ACFFD2_05340 [Promethearchaeota archaeon]
MNNKVVKNNTNKKDNEYGTLVARDGILGYVLAKKVEDRDKNLKTPVTVPFFLEGNTFYLFVFKHVFIGPDQDLPRFYLEREDGSVKLIDPARKILTSSPLTNYSSQGILIPKEKNFMDILEPVNYLSLDDDSKEIQKVLTTTSFSFLNYLPNYLQDENLVDVLANFIDKYQTQFSDENKREILKILAILIQKGLDPDNEKIQQVFEFLKGNYNSLSTGFQNNQVVGVTLDKVSLGDLVVFEDNNQKIATVLTKTGKTCVFNPLFEIGEDGKFNRNVSKISYGALGSNQHVNNVFDKFKELGRDEETIAISVGNILNTKVEYPILFHPRKINHSVIAAIAGGGKGNLNKIIAKNNAFLPQKERLAMILFDDVPEFGDTRSATEWGLKCLEGLFDKDFPIDFINPKAESSNKLSLIHIPAEEIIRDAYGLRAENAFYTAKFLYYSQHEDNIPEINGEKRFDVVTPSFLEWILFNNQCVDLLQEERYRLASIEVMQRTVRNFLRRNRNFLRGYVDYRDRSIKNDDIQNKANLIDYIIGAIEKRKIIVINQSELNDQQKLTLQRSVIYNILDYRETYSSKNETQIPCQIIIEEATSLMEEQASDQLKIFRKVQVKARKYGIGLTLVLQHSDGLDQRLISQLGWMVALPIPSDGIRNKLIKNAAGDFGPFDLNIKKAATGQGVFCQNQRLAYLPVPVQIWHYEEQVELLFRQKVAKSKNLVKESIANFLKEHDIPQESIDRIMEGEKTND